MKNADIQGIKKYMIRTLIVPVCAIILSGCAHYYYLPANSNVPLFKEKNEFRGSLSMGGGSMSSGIDLQAAIAPINHFAVMTNFMSSRYSSDDRDDKNSIKANYFEGAAGYFQPFNKYFVFEVYGGFGAGSQHHEYYAWPGYTYRGNSDLSFTKSFVQPSIGMTFNYFEIAFSSSISRLNFIDVNNAVEQTSAYYNELNLIDRNRKSFLIEPAITVRGGWKYVKMQFQILRSFNMTNDDLMFEPAKFSLGVSVSISKRYLKD